MTKVNNYVPFLSELHVISYQACASMELYLWLLNTMWVSAHLTHVTWPMAI